VGLQSMTDQNRQRFLRHFFTRPLPRAVGLLFGDAYGEPGSSQRLRKMAEVMAANCKNFKRNDRSRYAAAIHDYESDLEYLRLSFYAGLFLWPSVG
jgi:hypothetical protein